MSISDEMDHRFDGDAAPPVGGREAMRAFLQRGETRLSTMQRIAGAFLSGAGLLILLPFLLGDALSSVLSTALSEPRNLTLLVPYFVSVALPTYALYKLVEDLVKFYFSPVHQGDGRETELSKFALTGLAFPPDESGSVKAEVLRIQHEDDSMVTFAIGERPADTQALQAVFDQVGIELVDEIRQGYFMPTTRVLSPVQKFDVAMSVTGSRDRTLYEETARMEASLLRHTLILRRLVLRYAKALLLTIWTTIVTTVVVALFSTRVGKELGHDNVRVALGAYLAWALLVPIVVRLPLRWIRGANDRVGIRDPSLLSFEKRATAAAAFAATVTAILLALDMLGAV